MFNVLLDKHAPFKYISKYKQRFKSKPWLTTAIQKSIGIKNKLFTKYIKTKNTLLKNVFHERYITCRNLLATLTKQSKKNYYVNYFNRNINDIKNTWKGIKSVISNSNSENFAPNCILQNDFFFI